MGTTKKRVIDLKIEFDQKVEPDNPRVNEEAVLIALKYPGDLTINQITSIYSYLKNGDDIKKGWGYVRDPRGIDYLRYANASLKLGDRADCVGGGDCDDFAILMAALVESVGGTTRIILARNTTTGGHAYTEVYLGRINDPNNQVGEIIDWLKENFDTDKIFTHIDSNTKDVWLNLDWGPDEKGYSHPGGPFYQGDGHIVICIRDIYEKETLNLPLISKGWTLYRQGKYDDAIKAYDEAIRLDPNLASAWNEKGKVLFMQRLYDSAIQAYDEAISLDPNFAMAWFNKGFALNAIEKFDEAIQAYNEAIRLDPNYKVAWYNKGETLGNQGKYDEAIKAYDEAIRLDPMYFAPWEGKGISLKNVGEYEEAIKAFDEAIRLYPNSLGSWSNKAIVLAVLGRNDESNATFAKFKEITNMRDTLN